MTEKKTVYLNGAPVGAAATWHEAAAIVSRALDRGITAREAQNQGSEGPDGFHLHIAPSNSI